VLGCAAGPEPLEETTTSTPTEEPDSQETEDFTPQTREVADRVGRKVTIPVKPQKVATMQGPTYEVLFALGAKDQIGLVRDDHTTAYPLAQLTNPELTNYPVIYDVGPKTPVNVEEFLDQEVDLVIYWNIEQELIKFENADIPVVVIMGNIGEPESLEDYLQDSRDQLSFVADILGGNAPERYEMWEKYLEETIEFIRSRTKDIPEEERPIVYWGNSWGTNILATWDITSNKYVMELCGGHLVGPVGGGQFPEITKEQLLAWNPEVIIVDNHGRNPKEIEKDLQTSLDWAPMPAVQNNRLYRIPAGVFFIDKGTCRALYFYWLAKQLQPDLFEDVDLIKEFKYYYKTFYDYDLSTEEAEKVLDGWVAG
jgi:iron complex transport system substrate-binding protein